MNMKTKYVYPYFQEASLPSMLVLVGMCVFLCTCSPRRFEVCSKLMVNHSQKGAQRRLSILGEAVDLFVDVRVIPRLHMLTHP